MSNSSVNTTMNSTIANATNATNTTMSTYKPPTDLGAEMGSLLVILAASILGGALIQLTQGIKIGKCNLKPCCPALKIPVLLGMLIFGTLARNLLGDDIKNNFPDIWTGWIRTVALCLLLLRGGTEITFKGQGMIVGLLALGPQIFEGTAVALTARAMYGMTWPLCFAFGFVLGAVSPAVVVPSLLTLQDKGFGTIKKIPTTLIAASAFDDIIAITFFGIFASLAYSIEGISAGGSHADWPVGLRVLWDLGQIVIGIIVGLLLSLPCKFMNNIKSNNCRYAIKYIVCIIAIFAFPLASHFTQTPETKYIGVMMFGYGCSLMWGEDKPKKGLAITW
jgi:NhaP-type Na+/H+ or K+/H+ antiporter